MTDDNSVARASVDAAAQQLSIASFALSEATEQLAAARVALTPPPAPIDTPAAFERALAAAVPGQLLTLVSTLVYPGPVVLRAPITLMSDTYVSRQGERMTVDEPAPRFLGGISLDGDGVRLLGVEQRHTDPMHAIVTMRGTGCTLLRPRVLGDAIRGGKRGIEFRGALGVIRHGYVDDIFGSTFDTQAIYSQEMLPGGGLLVEHCYLRAAGEVVMFGGGDSSSEAAMPSNVGMNDIDFDKRPEWRTVLGPGKQAQQVKNGLEFKACNGFRGTSLRFYNCGGIVDGQGGYALVFTPRNQGKTAPWSCVRDIVIDGFTIEGGSGIATFLGSDNNAPSGPADGITLRNGVVTNLDRLVFGVGKTGQPQATGRLFTFERGPRNVELDTIRATGINCRAYGYFMSQTPPTGLKIANMDLPTPTAYTWKLDADTRAPGQNWPVGVRAGLLAYMPDAQLDESVK